MLKVPSRGSMVSTPLFGLPASEGLKLDGPVSAPPKVWLVDRLYVLGPVDASCTVSPAARVMVIEIPGTSEKTAGASRSSRNSSAGRERETAALRRLFLCLPGV